MSREERNLRTFVASLAIALAFFVLFSWPDHGWTYRLCALSLVPMLIWQSLVSDPSESRRLLYWTLLSTLVVGVIAPISGAGESPAAALRDATARAAIWPQALVALFASRAFAAENARRLSLNRDKPFTSSHRLHAQSHSGAVALGAFLCIGAALFFSNAPFFMTDRATSIIVAAASGTTPVHFAILALFFFLIAIEIDALWTCAKDHMALARIRRSLAGCARESAGPTPEQYAQEIASERESYGQSAAVLLLCDLSQSSASATLSFRAASRRFVRNLLPLLPLLGFLGTVVGLAISLAELQTGLAPGVAGGTNISGALSGLAIKFQTTILGLLANIAGLALLNFCEKCEADLVTECGLVADAIEQRKDRSNALS